LLAHSVLVGHKPIKKFCHVYSTEFRGRITMMNGSLERLL
jgi:hypothetical protein